MSDSLPFRPLPKIIARGVIVEHGEGGLRIGDEVKIMFIPILCFAKPFWRLYEVTVIDDTCRLVTPDKRYAMNAETIAVTELRDLQRRLRK